MCVPVSFACAQGRDEWAAAGTDGREPKRTQGQSLQFPIVEALLAPLEGEMASRVPRSGAGSG